MRPISACNPCCSGVSTSSSGLGNTYAAAAACGARSPLTAPVAAPISCTPLPPRTSCLSHHRGVPGTSSTRQRHHSAFLIISAVTGSGVAGGATSSGAGSSSGGGGRLTRGRTARTTLSAPSPDAVEAQEPQSQSLASPQQRLKRRTEVQVLAPEAPAGATPAGSSASAPAGISATDYASWKVSELQDALAARGLPRTGRKADLVERLAGTAAGAAAAAAAAAAAPAAAAAAGAAPPVPLPAAAAGADEASAAPAAPLRRRSRLTVTRTKVAADVDSGVGDDGARGTARTAAASKRAPAGLRSSDEEAGDGGGGSGILDALFDTLALDITVKEQRPGRRPPGAAGSAGGSTAGSLADTAGDRRPRPSRPTAAAPAAAGRGTDSLDSVDFGHGQEGDTGPEALSSSLASQGAGPRAAPTAAAPAAAAADAAASGDARPRRLTMRRERSSEAGDACGPAVPAAAASVAPAAAPAADGSGEGVRERRVRERPPPVGPAPDLSQLPPWPPQFLGRLRRLEEIAPGDTDKQEGVALENVHGLSLTCLGSAPGLAARAAAAGSLGEDRALGSLALSRGKDIFIFDVGDDTQRQVGQAYHVKPSKIFRIFLTSLAPEAVLGLPGLMCTINASRERGHELADIPVHVYGPPGTAAFLTSMMRVSQTYLEVTVVVHEFSPGHVSAAELAPIVGGIAGAGGPLAADKNRRISRLALPPDQLNPRGGVDASLLAFAPEQGRGQKRKGRNASGGVLSFDPRAGYLPWPELQPGDPDRRGLPDPLSLTWTLELDVSGRVVACLLPAAPGQPGAFGGADGGSQSYVLAYTVMEADRSGALVTERAAAAGLEGGPDFARLKQGETIANAWGQPIPPELIISPKRAGRRVVVAGNATDLRPLAAHPHARGADILVPGAVWSQAKAQAAADYGGCTTAAVGAAAAALGVRYVVLSRFSGPDTATAAAGGAEGEDLDRDELPMEAHTEKLVAEVQAAATAATADEVGGTGGGGGGGTSEVASTSRRRSVRKTAAGPGAGAGSTVPAAVAGSRLRRVLLLRDLDTALMEKNEGPLEPQE
ncbi:hypothetical protein HYH02_001183 [Chlamydomonas schloesseri]|uniref:SAP domain-containing protein n=1 Tax=Chlamydomonas schloesseri TaxID=2026947 RepID=A0A836BC53_9CHLO|nr:hypothetical protein HYH02_001183 [Chlamydomonas schloesseri]|eukprot:KAG2454147.1 hypothetical protein HYH02_001183 [Chlamydomonas schloesseri]